MKRIIFLFGLLLTVFSFSISNEGFAKDRKYKLKLKGEAARAYIRSHNLTGTGSRTTYSARPSHRHYAYHTTHRTTTHRTAAVTHRRHYGNRTAYHSTKNGNRMFSASSYAGYRQGGVRWNKLKIKRSDDKMTYKYKK